MVLLLAGCATGARAGEVPPTALSSSLRLDPMLLHSTSLVFRFPELVATADTMFLDFGRVCGRSMLLGYQDLSYATPSKGTGAVLRGAQSGGFVLSQASYLPGQTLGEYDLPMRGDVLQAGAGFRWRGLRAGVALRGTRYRREEGTTSESAPGARSERASRSVADFLEGAVGVGASLGPVQVDVAVELPWLRYDIEGILVASYDTLGLRRDGESVEARSAIARIAAPLGRGLHLVLAGTYETGHLAWSGHTYDGVRLARERFDQGLDAWSAAGSLSFPAPHVDRVVIAARYGRRRRGLALWSSPIRSTERRDDSGSVTFAGRRPLWRDLHLYAGVSKEYSRWRRDTTESTRGTRQESATLGESIGDGFAWGLSWPWRRFEFASSLNTTLALEDPFLRLDVQLEL
jgi:hypothetical protein